MQLNDFYEALRKRLKEEFNPTVYAVWIEPNVFRFSNGTLEIFCDSELRHNVVMNEFADLIKKCATELLGFDIELTFRVTSNAEGTKDKSVEEDRTEICEFKESDDEISKEIKTEIYKLVSLKAYNEWIKEADIEHFKSSDNEMIKVQFCFPSEFKANTGSHFYKEIRTAVNTILNPTKEIELVYSYYNENNEVVDIDFRLERIDKETEILNNVLNYIQEYYKFTTVDPFVFDFLFKNIKILEITHEEEQVDREERTIVSLNLQHKIIAEILQEHFRNEIFCAFYDVMDENNIFIRYTVDGDDYTHRYGQWLDDYFMDGFK